MLSRFLPVFLATLSAARGAVIVDPPAPLTHRVQVQPIIAANSFGVTAVFFGDAPTDSYIKSQINAIWAQVGVRIDWLAPATYASAFALDGSPGNYSATLRPAGDLSAIINGAGSPPKSANALVINAFFVDIVPAFNRTSIFTSNGYARVDANGTAIHVGEGLLTFTEGRDVVASVVAHEIGHNLGLDHTASGGDNVMSPAGISERLNASQKASIFTNHGGIDGYELLQPLAVTTNYRVWADAHGLSGGPGDDDDFDGTPNVIEFMLNLEPLRADAPSLPTVTAAGATWTLRKVAGAVADGLDYRVEVSTDGRTWSAAGTPGSASTVVADNASSLAVTLTSGSAPGLLRLMTVIPSALAGGAESFLPLEAAGEMNRGRDYLERSHGSAIASPK